MITRFQAFVIGHEVVVAPAQKVWYRAKELSRSLPVLREVDMPPTVLVDLIRGGESGGAEGTPFADKIMRTVVVIQRADSAR